MTQDEWIAEGTRLFGPDQMDWKFVCPVCKHVASVFDWKAAGAPQNAVAVNCIGRYRGKKRAAFGRSNGPGPCDYAGYGLLQLNPVRVVTPDGKMIKMFAFAEEEADAGIGN